MRQFKSKSHIRLAQGGGLHGVHVGTSFCFKFGVWFCFWLTGGKGHWCVALYKRNLVWNVYPTPCERKSSATLQLFGAETPEPTKRLLEN
jgi:hypothetical protein